MASSNASLLAVRWLILLLAGWLAVTGQVLMLAGWLAASVLMSMGAMGVCVFLGFAGVASMANEKGSLSMPLLISGV